MNFRKWWKEQSVVILILIFGMVVMYLIHKHIIYIENVVYRRSLYAVIGIIIGLIISKIKKKTKS